MRPLRNSPVNNTGSDSPRGQPLTDHSFLGGFKGEEGQKLKAAERQRFTVLLLIYSPLELTEERRGGSEVVREDCLSERFL